MQKITIAVHGGAGPNSEYIKKNLDGYKDGLLKAVEDGFAILENGGTALEAVEKAVRSLEDNEIFNAGRGSALNNKGQVEMDAAIMDGKSVKGGAVANVHNVKHPITLAKRVIKNSGHVLLCGQGAQDFARNEGVEMEGDAYFVTPHQYYVFVQERDKSSYNGLLLKKKHGTVGAVAVDCQGNVAAATSTGGTENCLEGRIGDSCILGAGCYANNLTCAVSGTGDGEFLMNGVVAHSVSSAIEYTRCSVQQACDHVIHEKNKNSKGDMGVIAVNTKGDVGISFNSERMHRAWKSTDTAPIVKIYNE